jgi:hypothetical protein
LIFLCLATQLSRTPLHLAAATGNNCEIVRELLVVPAVVAGINQRDSVRVPPFVSCRAMST